MLRTDAESFTPKEHRLNAMASDVLIPGATYHFDPPVRATAIPTGGPEVCDLEMAEFQTGYYCGYSNNVHVFQDKPLHDSRLIRLLPGYEDCEQTEWEDLAEGLRECFFYVAFLGGSSVTLLKMPPIS